MCDKGACLLYGTARNFCYSYECSKLKRTVRKELLRKHLWKPSCKTNSHTTEKNNLFFGLLNCHSVCNNKTVLLNDYISSQNFDIFCITETWLGMTRMPSQYYGVNKQATQILSISNVV